MIQTKLQLVRKGQPDSKDLHTNRPLTNMSLAIFQNLDNLLYRQVFPELPVSKRSDEYTTYPRGQFNRNPMKKRAPGAETPGVGYEPSKDNYFAHVWGLHVDIEAQDEDNADEQFDLDQEAMELLTAAAAINREVEWASAFWATSKWTQDVTGIASSPSATQFIFWDDYTNSNQLVDVAKWIKNQVQKGLPRPNVLAMDFGTWTALKNHPVILDRINRGQTSGPAMVQRQSVAALMELDRIAVGEGAVNNGLEGGSDSFAAILGDNALLVYVAPRVGRYTPTAGLTFAWKGYRNANGAGIRVNRFDMPLTASRRIEIESAYALKLVAPDLGVFFSNTLA